MIAATQVGQPARLVDDKVAAMGADIGQEAQHPVVIPYQDQRFVEEPLQQGEGIGVAGAGNGPYPQ
jgi:hypothetical protein